MGLGLHTSKVLRSENIINCSNIPSIKCLESGSGHGSAWWGCINGCLKSIKMNLDKMKEEFWLQTIISWMIKYDNDVQ